MQQFEDREAESQQFDDQVIAAEAYGLWEAEGSPLWGHPVDHWLRAIDNLRRRAAGAEVAVPGTPPPNEPPPLP